MQSRRYATFVTRPVGRMMTLWPILSEPHQLFIIEKTLCWARDTVSLTKFPYPFHKVATVRWCHFQPTLQRSTAELHLYYSKTDVVYFLVCLLVVDHYMLHSVQLF